MKKSILVFLFIISLLAVSNSARGQFSMSFSYSEFHRIGIGYNFSPKIWTELRIYNSFDLNNAAELAVLYNVSIKERHEIYIGFSGILSSSFGFSIPCGLQFSPLENFRQFSLQIEFAPVIVINGGVAFLSSAGIRYAFGKNKVKQQTTGN